MQICMYIRVYKLVHVGPFDVLLELKFWNFQHTFLTLWCILLTCKAAPISQSVSRGFMKPSIYADLYINQVYQFHHAGPFDVLYELELWNLKHTFLTLWYILFTHKIAQTAQSLTPGFIRPLIYADLYVKQGIPIGSCWNFWCSM